jgi:hypothetical protein
MPFKSKAQQRFMYATMPKTAEKWSHETPNIKKLPQHVKKESVMEMEPSQFDHPGCDDKVGQIFVVLKPTPEASPEDLVHQTHAFGMGQFNPHGVHGVYGDGEEANIVAEAACNEMHKHLRAVEAKKDAILSKIDENIARLQKEINAHMKEATERPELSERHHGLAQKKMAVIGNLRNKHKVVKESKKQLPKKADK